MSPNVVCPSFDIYERLLAGDSSPREAEQAAEHLETCSRCGDLVRDLIQRDTLVGSLRGDDTPIATGKQEQQVLGDLMSRLRQLAPSVTNADTAAPRPTANELIDFLAAPQAQDEVGRLGSYRILKVLGSGGMGVVYLAEDTHLKRKVALKAMLPKLASSASARARFLREAQTAAAIEHDHIVPIFQVGEDRGVPFIAMPLLKGLPLDERLTKEPRLTPAEILRIGQETARGLAAAHAEGLIHRDIKPANLWLEGKEGRVKILDFGLARALVDQTQLTQDGCIIGTPAYMAPEQGMGQVVDHRCDLFSLGCVLYRLCTGELPFKGNNTLAILSALAMQNPPAPAAINPAVSASLSALVMRLLAKEPADRPASAQLVVEALQTIADQPTDESKSITATIAPNDGVTAALDKAAPEPTVAFRLPAPRRPRRAAVLAAVALLALIGVGILFGGQIIRIVTNQGELVITVDDPDVEVKIVQNGVVVQDKTTKREFTLSAGKGEIEVLEKDGIKLATRQFELTRGGKTTVKVTLQELADARKPRDPDPAVKKDPPAIPASADPDRRAAEWVLSIGSTITIKENGKEREINAVGGLPRGAFELTVAILSLNPKVSDAGLAAFKDCKNLTYLTLYACHEVTDAGIAYLKDCNSLMGLNLMSTRVSDAGLAHFRACKNLTELSLDSTAVTDAGLAHFKDCKNLAILGLAGAQVSDAGLAHFRECKNLTSIILSDNTQVTDAGLAHFKDCKNLTHLQLKDCTKVTDAGLAHLKECKNLTYLQLYGIALTDVGLAHFKECKNLTYLDLSQTQMSDAGLVHFKECKNLTGLVLGGTQVSGTGLVHFKDCKNLRDLRLGGSIKVTDAGLAHLKECKNLGVLNLCCPQVTDAGLAHFKECKDLNILALSYTQVSDTGLTHFKDSKNLAQIDLAGTQVSDAALADLAGLPILTDLWLANTRVSLRGHEQLKAAMPKCQITWSEPNRSVAEGVLALGGTVEIGTRDKPESRPVKLAADLPADYFQVRRVSLASVAKPLDQLLGQLKLLRFPEFDRLESIDLSGITGLDYAFLAPIHGLRELSLAKAGRSDAALATYLPKLPGLKRLVLDGNAMGGPGLTALDKQPALTELSLASTGLDDAALAQLPKLPALKRLVLDGNDIRGSGLTHLNGRPELIDLSLGCPILGDLFAKNLAELKQVKRLSLAGSGLTDTGIKHLSSLTNLESLNLRDTKVTAAGVATLQTALPTCKIERDFESPGDPDRRAAEWVLSIGEIIKITENGKEREIEAVGDLPKGSFKLTGVRLIGNPKVSDAGLAHFKDCKDLSSLYLDGCPMTDAGLEHFKDSKNLTSLALGGNQLTDAGLAHFKDCKNLTYLALRGIQASVAGLAHFKGCKNLTGLNLTGAHVTDAGLAHFQECQKLTSLELLGDIEVTDAGLEHFKNFENLASLSLNCTQVTDAGLAHFKNCKNLAGLSLNCTQVTDAGLAHFKNCKNLGTLRLGGNQVTDAGLAHFRHCKILTLLYLSSDKVTGAGLSHLKDCNITGIDLSFTQVSDAGLVHLKNCKNLAHLFLGQTPVSDAGLADLANLPNLATLELGNTRISLRGHEQLKAAMPKCQITWSEPNRSVAEGVLALGGTVEIGTRDKPESRFVKLAADLPPDYFQVRRVSLAGVAKPLGNLTGPLSELSMPTFDRLESIDLSGIALANYSFLAPIHGLRDLGLAKTGLNDAALAQLLAKQPALKRLVLDGNSIGGPGLTSLEKAPALTEVSLASTGLDDAVLAQLPKLPALKRLVLDGNDIRGHCLAKLLGDRPDLIDLSLGCPSLTDLHARNLTELKQVKCLSLAGSGLTDASIKYLSSLTNLESLNLRDTKVTAAGVATLQTALPTCKIERDGK